MHALALSALATTACSERALPFENPDPAGIDAPMDLGMTDLPARDLASPDLFVTSLCQRVVVSTLAGNGTASSVDGTGGPNGTAAFNNPYGVAIDGADNLYVSDIYGNRIRKLAPDGTTTTLAGDGGYGFMDGTGGPNGTTEFRLPGGIAIDGDGNLYVGDGNNYRIRKVAPNGSTTTLAGNGTQGFVDGTGGPNGTTELGVVDGVSVDGAGNVYVADVSHYRIRKVAPNGDTSTLAGNGTAGFVDGTGGPNGTTEFNGPYGVAVDGASHIFVADYLGQRIREVAPNGNTTTLAGNGTAGFVDGTGGPSGTSQFNGPYGVAIDGAGNLFVAERFGYRIRRVAPDGTTTTVAGNGSSGFADGAGCTAQFNGLTRIAISGKRLFVTDSANQRIRQIRLP